MAEALVWSEPIPLCQSCFAPIECCGHEQPRTSFVGPPLEVTHVFVDDDGMATVWVGARKDESMAKATFATSHRGKKPAPTKLVKASKSKTAVKPLKAKKGCKA